MQLKKVSFLVLIVLLLYFIPVFNAQGQHTGQELIDSLIAELPKAAIDTNQVNLLNRISLAYARIDPEKGVIYGEQSAALASQVKWKQGKAISLKNIGLNYYYMNAFEEANTKLLQSLEIAEQINLTSLIAIDAIILGLSYEKLRQYASSLHYYLKSIPAYKKTNATSSAATALYNASNMYDLMGRYPEAIALATELYDFSVENGLASSQAKACLVRGSAYNNLSNYPLAQQNNFEALKINEQLNNKKEILDAHLSIAVIFQTQGDTDKALEHYNKALLYAEELGALGSKALTLSNIGSVYDGLKDHEQARYYYGQALEIYVKYEDTKQEAMTVYNIGGIYMAENNYAEALASFNQALAASQAYGDQFQEAAIIGLIGATYHQMGLQEDSAMLSQYFNNDKITAMESGLMYTDSAIAILVDLGELKNRAFYLNQKSIIESTLGHFDIALESYKKYAEINDSLFNIERDKKLIQAEMGYTFGKREDSLSLENTKQQLALQNKIDLQKLSFEYDKKEAEAKSDREKEQLAYEEAIKRQEIESEYARKQAEAEALLYAGALERKQAEALNQAELRRQRSFRNFALLGTAGLLIFSIIVFRQHNKVKKEKARSEELLLNILPAEVAAELKEKGRTDAKDFEMVSILFSDFKSFTEKSAKLSAQELVSEIHICFEAFDGIMEKYGIEKIKTIGDSYMAAGGLPIASNDSVKNTVLATLEMQSFISKRKLAMSVKGLPSFEMRVGIHTGPVVAGIVGIKKFQYDLWGDTVNTASRMESHGEEGRVNVSQSTYELLKVDPDFKFEVRGKIGAKGKGEMEMYFVERK